MIRSLNYDTDLMMKELECWNWNDQIDKIVYKIIIQILKFDFGGDVVEMRETDYIRQQTETLFSRTFLKWI